MLLLDTNVVSELRKVRSGRADKHVARWAERVDAAELFVSVVTLQELEMGVLLAERKDAKQGAVLRAWLDAQVIPAFAERIVPIDAPVALRAAALHVPDPRPVRDAYIAATALVHGLTVVTQNVADFEGTGARLLNPWVVKRPQE